MVLSAVLKALNQLKVGLILLPIQKVLQLPYPVLKALDVLKVGPRLARVNQCILNELQANQGILLIFMFQANQ